MRFMGKITTATNAELKAQQKHELTYVLQTKGISVIKYI
jgi:hypothetical protein